MFLTDGMQLMTLIREGRRKTKHDLYHRGIGLPWTPFKGVLFSVLRIWDQQSLWSDHIQLYHLTCTLCG